MMTITSKKFDLINPLILGLEMGGGIIIMRVYSFTTFDFILIKKKPTKTTDVIDNAIKIKPL